MANEQHIYTGNGAPVAAPADYGHHYVDTLNSQVYLSAGNSVVGDWKLVGAATGTPGFIGGFDLSGNLYAVPDWEIDSNTGGFNFNKTIEVDANGQFNLHQNSLGFEILQNSPAESWTMQFNNLQLDTTSSGFTFGTAGSCIALYNNNISHAGTGNTGYLEFFRNNIALGNGTDPITVNGFTYNICFGTVNANCTINGAVQGYIFQPNMGVGSIFGASSYIVAFADFSNIEVPTNGYTSINLSPQVDEIVNNTGFTGINLNPTVTTFSGNAGTTVIGVAGTYGTFDTGGFIGVNVNPNITSIVNATGIYIDMSNVTASGTKHALSVNGDVSINGALTFTGALSIGQLNAFYAAVAVDGGGTPTTLNGLVSAVSAPNGITTANADMIGLNTACLITLEANSITTSGPFGLGFAAIALPCVIETHTGSTLDNMSAATYAMNFVGSSTGGTVDTVNIARSLAIPNGITTINKVRGFIYEQPFGAPGTQNWGFYNSADCDNFFKQSLKVGGIVGSTDVVTNASVGIELESVTRAVLLSRMTTAERDALTALNGMILYNTTTSKIQGYAGGAWVDLH